MQIDNSYKEIVEKVLSEGYLYDDPNREGVQRLEIPSYTFKHDFKNGFPALSLKKLAWKSVVTELIWFLKGDTNIKYLLDNGCNIWNKDAYNYYLKYSEVNKTWFNGEKLTIDDFINAVKSDKFKDVWWRNPPYYKTGDLGKVYGHYWRNFNGVDQIEQLVNDMVERPMSSELLVVARNPADKKIQALPCCHYGFQIVMRPLNIWERSKIHDDLGYKNENNGKFQGDYLNDRGIPRYGFELHWKQRSCDLFLGIPFNIASYALLALILEKITGHKALGIQGDLKKVHLYDNSIEEAEQLIKRECSNEKANVLYKDEFHYITDKSISGDVSIDTIFNQMKPDWFQLENYHPQSAMRVEMLSRT